MSQPTYSHEVLKFSLSPKKPRRASTPPHGPSQAWRKPLKLFSDLFYTATSGRLNIERKNSQSRRDIECVVLGDGSSRLQCIDPVLCSRCCYVRYPENVVFLTVVKPRSSPRPSKPCPVVPAPPIPPVLAYITTDCLPFDQQMLFSIHPVVRWHSAMLMRNSSTYGAVCDRKPTRRAPNKLNQLHAHDVTVSFQVHSDRAWTCTAQHGEGNSSSRLLRSVSFVSNSPLAPNRLVLSPHPYLLPSLTS
ncbi:hypothetical protein BC827DRAFT_87532 [Russula dissimulans]|nr:hypothetical protein BC827DRAFT_87532 [Russula dissimulans]